MTTTEEMLRAGIEREVWISTVLEVGKLVVELDAAAHDRGDDAMVAICHAFMDGTNEHLNALHAENVDAFAVFQAAKAETDELEAMLAAGGVEVTMPDDEA